MSVRMVDSIDQAIEHIRTLRLEPHRDDRHAGRDARARVPAPRELELGVRERQHALLGRLPARPGRRGRRLDHARCTGTGRWAWRDSPRRSSSRSERERSSSEGRRPRRHVQSDPPRAPAARRRDARGARARRGCCLVPAGDPPLKRAGVAPADHRLEMVRRADRFEPRTRGLRPRAAPRRTELHRRHARARCASAMPGAALWFLVGADTLARPRVLARARAALRARELRGRDAARLMLAPLRELLPRVAGARLPRRTPRGLVPRVGKRAARSAVHAARRSPRRRSGGASRAGESIRYLVARRGARVHRQAPPLLERRKTD